MQNNFDASLNLLLKSEGGFVNNSKDPGGMTNLGVTKVTWEEYTKHPTTEAVMRSLTPELVAPLYKRRYWNGSNCDSLPSGLDYAVFDFAVNAGPGRAIKTLQEALGCLVDGYIGSKTLQQINATDPRTLIDKFSKAKEDFYKTLKTFDTFGKGWLNRIAEVKTNATNMIGGANGN